MDKTQKALKLAQAVIDAARAAMDESFEAGNEQMDISIPAHLAAALSLRLDEYDREALAEQQAQQERCHLCDCTGDIHSPDGEWRGECPYCKQPAQQQQEPVAWRELCRRLYIELYWCDRQMMETLDEDGEPRWTQGKEVRDVLADAKAALETSPPNVPPARASKPWVHATTWRGLTDEEIRNIWSNGDCFEEIAFARAIEAAHGIKGDA